MAGGEGVGVVSSVEEDVDGVREVEGVGVSATVEVTSIILVIFNSAERE